MTEIMVETTQGFTLPFDKTRIAATLVKETSVGDFLDLNLARITPDVADEIATEVEILIKRLGMPTVSGPMIREITNGVLLQRGMSNCRMLLTRVGMPVYDAVMTDFGISGRGDNANLTPNAETAHKRKADKISKEEALCLLPEEIRDLHNAGDIHIHDLEYLTVRPFCLDSDLRYFFYYGLMPDGTGNTASVAGPAKRAEVAILHAVKALAAAQTNCAGGQGFYNFLTFIAPYFEGMEYNDIKHHMQMFVYEMTQMMVARGGQVVFSSVQLSPGVPKLWKTKPVVYKGRKYDGVQAPRLEYGEFEREVRLLFKGLMDVMLEGDNWGKPFVFPKPEIALEWQFMEEDESFNRDNPDLPTYKDLYKLSFALASKFGTPYFDNMLPAYRDTENGISCYQCMPADEQVMARTDDGGVTFCNIEDIDITSQLWTGEDWKSPESILEQEFEGDLITIAMDNGATFRCTPDHEVPVYTGEPEATKVSAGNLKVGDILMMNPNLPVDGVALTNALDIVGLPQICDITFAWFVGLYLQEGGMAFAGKARKTGGRLQFYLNGDEKEYYDALTQLMDESFNWGKSRSGTYRAAELRVELSNAKLCRKLLSIGLPESPRRNGWIPDFILSAPDEVKWAFLEGYMNGCTKTGQVITKQSFVHPVLARTHSLPIANGVAAILRSFGYAVEISGDADRIMFPDVSYPYNVQLVIGEALLNLSRNEIRRGLRGRYYHRISKITRTPYTGLVYDPVNVPGHQFALANGIIVGNCCAYQFSCSAESDTNFDDKMEFIDGQHFSMGSYMVVTLNLPRIAYRANGDIDLFIAEVEILMGKVVSLFRLKRKWMDKIRLAGRMPFLTQRPRDPHTGQPGDIFVDFDSLVYTIGIVGMNEVVEIISGKQLHESQDSVKLTMKIMLILKKYAEDLERDTGMTIAFARTPAETTGQRFAVSDLLNAKYSRSAAKFVKGDINTALHTIGDTLDLPIYYTNGCHILPSAPIPITDRILTESMFFPLVDGGNILHIWLGEATPDPVGLMDMTMNLAKNTNAGYFAYTRDITVCKTQYHEAIPRPI